MRVSTSMLYENGTARFQDRAADLLKLQQQVSTGRRVVTPSDDPIASASALVVEQAKGINTQYGTNRAAAKDALYSAESRLKGVADLISYVKERTIQAGNGALSDADLRAIATDIRARHDALIGLANAEDAEGGYMFAGYRTDSAPFQGTISSGVVYTGDQGARSLQVSDARILPVTNSGNDVFMQVENLNGQFNTRAGASNTGSGVIDDGTVTGAYTGHNYQIVFTGPGTYDVLDTTLGGPAIASGAYTSGSPIAFDGLEVRIVGTPAAGDTFDLAPGGYADMFSTLRTLVGAFESGNRSALNTFVAQGIGRLDNALENVLRVQSSIGSRINEADAIEAVGSQADVQYAGTLSRLVDLDYAKASSDLAQKQVGLEAAQKAFVSTTQLSLFNYI